MPFPCSSFPRDVLRRQKRRNEVSSCWLSLSKQHIDIKEWAGEVYRIYLLISTNNNLLLSPRRYQSEALTRVRLCLSASKYNDNIYCEYVVYHCNRSADCDSSPIPLETDKDGLRWRWLCKNAQQGLMNKQLFSQHDVPKLFSSCPSMSPPTSGDPLNNLPWALKKSMKFIFLPTSS